MTRHKTIFTTVFFIIFSFASCGRTDACENGARPARVESEIHQCVGEEYSGTVYINYEHNGDATLKPEVEQAVHLTGADFLYDFDYMISALEANFPYFGIIYRLNGVDMIVVAQDMRVRLENMYEEIDFENFWNMLRDDFFYYAIPDKEWFLPIGHLSLFSDAERRWFISRYEAATGWNMSSYFLGILNNPPTHPSYPYLNADPKPPIGLPSQTLSTSIIYDGIIGYLRVYRLWGGVSLDEEEILTEFFSDIADFEHLIIDIRGNTGGAFHLFNYYITSFLTNQIIATRFHHFLMDGEHNMRFFRATRQTLSGFGGESSIFLGNTASSYIMEDLSLMSHRFPQQIAVNPRPVHQRSLFDGKVWLLIDGKSYSSAMYVAAILSATRFATLVGETTSGGGGSPWGSNFIVLPNTGIIIRYDPTFVTDAWGHPLEYGIEPHYFNLPGLDALETVLELIARGDY